MHQDGHTGSDRHGNTRADAVLGRDHRTRAAGRVPTRARADGVMGAVDKLGKVTGVIFLDCAEDVMIKRMDKSDCGDEIALLAQFTEHCLPCLDLYDRAGLLHVVDAGPGIDEVQAALQTTLGAL